MGELARTVRETHRHTVGVVLVPDEPVADVDPLVEARAEDLAQGAPG